MIFVSLGSLFLPRQFLGKWNSIYKLGNKEIIEVLLIPSKPNWEVNLVNKKFSIRDKKEIDTLLGFLQKTTVYFPSHPLRIWETKLIIISRNKDSLEIEIHQNKNNGTVIYTPTNEWRKDEIGNYLERLTNYIKPAYSDTSTTKF